MLTLLLSLAVVLFLTEFAYRHRDAALYAIAGAAVIGFGVMFIPTSKLFGGLLIAFGIYTAFLKSIWDKKRTRE
jgi:uncharacterized membrane protein